VGRHDRLVTEPLHPIDTRSRRGLDGLTPVVRLTPVERDLQREKREQERSKRRRQPYKPPVDSDGHVDLRA
jgi:hypothetical protein